MNNARYNYILRTNPYKFPSSILFDNNYSIRDDWENKIKDFLGDTVNIINCLFHMKQDRYKKIYFSHEMIVEILSILIFFLISLINLIRQCPLTCCLPEAGYSRMDTGSNISLLTKI